MVRAKLFGWWPRKTTAREASDEDPMEQVADCETAGPLAQTAAGEAARALKAALGRLPARQQQTFLLRAWEGLSVDETNTAMGCSQGTVKTRYSRAIHTLKLLLGKHWP